MIHAAEKKGLHVSTIFLKSTLSIVLFKVTTYK